MDEDVRTDDQSGGRRGRRRRSAGRPPGPPQREAADQPAEAAGDLTGADEAREAEVEAAAVDEAAVDEAPPSDAGLRAEPEQDEEPAPEVAFTGVFMSPSDQQVPEPVTPEIDLEEVTATAFFLAPEFDPAEYETEPTREPAAEEPPAEAPSGQRRKRNRGKGSGDSGKESGDAGAAKAEDAAGPEAEEADDREGESPGSRRRRRRRRRTPDGDGADEKDSSDSGDGVLAVKGSTRLEAKRQRRKEGRDAGRRRSPVISEAEFLARRESVDRTLVVRSLEERTQIAVLEDDILVEHYVARERNASMIGDVYLGRVQNVLPSMEAAFIDIGRGRNAVLYAGEVNWQQAGLEGQPKRIELALKPGDSVLVQVTKDPVGQKGARLTSQIALPGRYLVFVPNGRMTGISRKLPDKERNRLKKALKAALPENAGVIVRTAAEGASEEQLSSDVARLSAQWEDINGKAGTAKAPAKLYGEPDLAIRVVRDIFNEDFGKMVISGDHTYDMLSEYIGWVAPELSDRISKWAGTGDVFAEHRIDEQIVKALDRKVNLPSGGSLVIDRTEAMTVIDVNTGRFIGAGGNLEETVTRNNLEAAEEIVRQLRLRDVGGIIVVDFIDMVLESNRDLVVRRLVECLGRDRTKHQVAEITSLGLVQMTRKRIGQGLLETFSEPCEHCNGRGVKVRTEPVGAQRRKRPPGPIPGAPIKSEGKRETGPEAEAPAPEQSPTGGSDGSQADAADLSAQPEAEPVPAVEV